MNRTLATGEDSAAQMHLFEAPQSGEPFPMHYDIHRLFRPREIGELCRKALEAGPLSTVELAASIIETKGFPGADRHLRTSVAYKIVQALRMQEKRGGMVKRIGKRSGAIVWQLER